MAITIHRTTGVERLSIGRSGFAVTKSIRFRLLKKNFALQKKLLH